MANSLFWETQTASERSCYQKYLQGVGALSQLFTDSSSPYLYYRAMERAFCLAFNSTDLSRADLSIDSKKGILGIGLKTFLESGNSFQKIAEFNEARPQYQALKLADKARKIAELRNERLTFATSTQSVSKVIYHCVIRSKATFSVLEEPMEFITIEKIKGVKQTKGGFKFHDDKNEYKFSLSKSTLLKYFDISTPIFNFDVTILKNPFLLIEKMLTDMTVALPTNEMQTIYLPLYSIRSGDVEDKSGLNQWNASGRKRHEDEVYIPIPGKIHKAFPSFFPARKTPFQLKLPNSSTLSVKVCQENDKALMSDPNKDLGRWLLRDVLKLNPGELLTMKKLNAIGIDSVRIDKFLDGSYEINFARSGSYSEFESQIGIKSVKKR